MPSITKEKSSEIGVTSANTVSNATVVRLYATANTLVTVANTGGTIGTLTLPGGRVEYVEKAPTDTIAANTSIRAVSVAHNT